MPTFFLFGRHYQHRWKQNERAVLAWLLTSADCKPRLMP